jgi:hypothetical protein
MSSAEAVAESCLVPRPVKAMKNTLGLGGDWDDVEFIEAVEAAFGIALDKEPESWSTFGDVFDTVCRHVQPVERGPFPCLSASAYRRLRSAIVAIRPNSDVRPDTPLKNLIGNDDVSGWWRGLERNTGLRLPRLAVAGWATLLFFALWLAIPGVVIVNDLPGWMAVILPTLWLFAFRWLPSRPPVRTVGDLARAVAVLNAKGMSARHGAIRTRDVWDSLVWIARDVSAHNGPIDRKTTLLA